MAKTCKYKSKLLSVMHFLGFPFVIMIAIFPLVIIKLCSLPKANTTTDKSSKTVTKHWNDENGLLDSRGFYIEQGIERSSLQAATSL